MIFINPDAAHIKAALEHHKEFLLPFIKKNRNTNSNAPVKKFLDDKRILQLLEDPPEKLLEHQQEFMEYLPLYSLKQWEEYIDLKQQNIAKKNLTPRQVVILDDYKFVEMAYLNNLRQIIKYTGGFAQKESTPYGAYDLARHLDITTCPYCNRLYTKTVYNKRSKIIRPEFDHWYPKGTYPLLALSFFNLIPSCHICNSNVKGSENMNLQKYLHPYVDEKVNYHFSYRTKSLGQHTFVINRAKNSKEDRTIKAFKLERIYEAHEDEILDLIRLRKLYSVRYLIDLRNLINKKNPTQSTNLSELYRLAFYTYDDPAQFHKRPLSKMKFDILNELGVIFT